MTPVTIRVPIELQHNFLIETFDNCDVVYRKDAVRFILITSTSEDVLYYRIKYEG